MKLKFTIFNVFCIVAAIYAFMSGSIIVALIFAAVGAFSIRSNTRKALKKEQRKAQT